VRVKPEQVLEQQRIAAQRRIKDADAEDALGAISIKVIASTGVAKTRIRLVAYIDQMNSGRRNQVIPGARISWIVTMKFKPVSIEEKPAMNTPVATAKTCELENVVEYGA
jgi:hypothetical protein